MGSEEVVTEAVEPGGGGRPVACIAAACVVERSVFLDMPWASAYAIVSRFMWLRARVRAPAIMVEAEELT